MTKRKQSEDPCDDIATDEDGNVLEKVQEPEPTPEPEQDASTDHFPGVAK